MPGTETTTDLYGNDVGKFTLFNASEADITFSTQAGMSGGDATCMNVNISYSIPIQPVATFGKDVVFAKGTPQGTFSFGQLAGNKAFAMTASNCNAGTCSVDFGGSDCVIKRSEGGDLVSNAITLMMHNAVFSQFSIQGSAQDAFFTENVGGFYHYLTKTAGKKDEQS